MNRYIDFPCVRYYSTPVGAFMGYVWQIPKWPCFTYDRERVAESYSTFLGFRSAADTIFSILDPSNLAALQVRTLSSEIVSSLEIEGETVGYESVISSVSKHLGVRMYGKDTSSSYSDDLSHVAFEALDSGIPMTSDVLFSWHKGIMAGASHRPKYVGVYRTKPEYVVRAKGLEYEVVYQAIDASLVPSAMEKLCDYVNNGVEDNPIAKSAIAALNFVVVHPFSDGNGRISRLVSSYVQAKEHGDSIRAFSQSSLILEDRDTYYSLLNSVTGQSDSLDVTDWVLWNIRLATEAQVRAVEAVKKSLKLTAFFRDLDPCDFNSRQLSMLYKLADGTFFGKLTKSKWMKINKCSEAVAFRDMSQLVNRGFLIPTGETGPQTGYFLNPDIVETCSLKTM